MNTLFLAAALTCGQCSSCSPAAPQTNFFPPAAYLPAPVANQVFEWKLVATGSDNWAGLYRNGLCVGGYFDGRYYPWDGKRWCDPFPPKNWEGMTETAAEIAGRKVRIPNFGVELNKIHTNPKLTGDDESVIPDDNNKLRVTIRSDDKEVIKQITSAVKPFKDHVLTQTYPPGHWALQPGLDYGLFHIQAPPRADGKAIVLHSQNDFSDGVEGVSLALRQADPTFQKDSVPDLRKGSDPLGMLFQWLQSPGPIGGYPWWMHLVVAAGLAYYFRDKWMSKPPDIEKLKAEFRSKK